MDCLVYFFLEGL